MKYTKLRTRTHSDRSTPVWAAAFIAALALVFTAACGTKRSVGTRIDDAWITSTVKSKIAADPELNPFEVDVDTENGVVRLSGTVETESDRAEMVRHARDTKGVVRVENDIRLGDPTIAENIEDTVIESKVKAKLAGDPVVSPFRLDVDVVQGVVTLSGEVDNDETMKEAIELAKSTRGVKRVETRIKVTEDA